MDRIAQKPNDREITWYVDTKGGCGKSVLMNHIKYVRKEAAFCSPMTSKLCDLIKKPYEVFCFNVARCYAKNVNYNLLENLKDG